MVRARTTAANADKATRAAPLVDAKDTKEVVQAAATAFRAAAAARKAYPKIEACFRLGWHMAELYVLAEQATPAAADDAGAADAQPDAPADRLPSAGDLDAETHQTLLLRQIAVDRKEIEAVAAIPEG